MKGLAAKHVLIVYITIKSLKILLKYNKLVSFIVQMILGNTMVDTNHEFILFLTLGAFKGLKLGIYPPPFPPLESCSIT